MKQGIRNTTLVERILDSSHFRSEIIKSKEFQDSMAASFPEALPQWSRRDLDKLVAQAISSEEFRKTLRGSEEFQSKILLASLPHNRMGAVTCVREGVSELIQDPATMEMMKNFLESGIKDIIIAAIMGYIAGKSK